MSSRLRAHIRSNVVGYLALFLVLTGGTAYALDGSNTVFSDDITNGQVQRPDIALDAINTSRVENQAIRTDDLAAGSVTSLRVLNDSLTPADLADVGFLRSDSASLNDPVPGGGSDTETLFEISGVPLLAICSVLPNGNLLATVQVGNVEDLPGRMLVVGDSVIELVPEDVQFIGGASSDSNLVGSETSFAILDHGGESASGTTAVTADPATGDCVISAQAAG